MLDRGLHHKIWARSTLVTNEAGIVRYRTNSYTELHTGVSFRNPDTGLLEDSSPDFVITPQGYALASKCQHRLIVSADASDPEGVIDCQMPDDRRLRSRLAGLYLFSPVTGKSLQIAAPTSCAAEQTAPNEITFPDVLDGMLKASLRIRNERGGYHHDLLLNERFSDAQLEKLAALGFDSNMRLEVWSEFLESPSPAVQEAVVRTEAKASVFAEPNSYDALVDFGTMRLGLGRSFVDGEDGDDCARVSKQWLRIQQRSFLIETARFSELAPLMDRLPASTMTVKNSKLDSSRLLAGRIPPPKTDQANKELSAQNKSHLQVARFDPAKRPQTSPRLVLDYSVLNGTITNLTLHSEGTWFVTGPVNVSGTLEFLPGCVVKFTNSPVVLMGASNIVCKTGPYSMGVLTSWCDDSVGETIPQSTGNPTNYNAGTYLQEQWFWNTNAIKYLRFLYAGTALHFKPRDGIWHCQFLNCDKAVRFTIDSTLWLHNVLFSGCFNAIHGSGVRINGEHLTVEGTYFNRSPCVVCITNSIFIGAISTGDLYFDTYHFATNSTRDGVFQALGAANYYLANNSENRFKGRTEINPTLLADLERKSTYPPALYYQTNVSGSLIFHPRNEPTNSQPPDLGYAYDRLDYLVCGLVLTNAALTISPGTAVATYQTNQIGYGIGLGGGAQLFCEGSPTNFVHVTVYNTVQEQPIQPTFLGWRIPGFSINDYAGTPRSARLRFTRWSRVLAQGIPGFSHFEFIQSTPTAVSDCHFQAGIIGIYGAPVQMTNCLFEHTWVDLEPGYVPWPVTDPSFVRNNLFIAGLFGFWSTETNSLIADNLFDGTGINFLGSTFNASFNAYVTNSGTVYYRLWPTNVTDIILPASPQYQSGPLGEYYQLASSVLINADTNTTADQVGLYHYTTTTNIVGGAQIKETNSWVDVGIHYIALDSSGNPVDSDGGGVPDFIENGAGDGGTSNVNESNWRYEPDDFRYLLTPGYLRVEYRVDPWGITTNYGPPRLYWIVSSSRRAEKQLAYQILVASGTNDLRPGAADMWDSGKVLSDQTIHVPYGGANLSSGQRLWWKVITWDP